jgi:hypothetical protein
MFINITTTFFFASVILLRDENVAVQHFIMSEVFYS